MSTTAAVLDPNPYMQRAADAIAFKYPRDVVNTFRPCDKNEMGDYGAHAWNRALDHWGKGPFGKVHMRFTCTYAQAHAGAWNVEAILYDHYAYRLVNDFKPERLPAEMVQHTDHCHIQFLPVTIGVPPGCE